MGTNPQGYPQDLWMKYLNRSTAGYWRGLQCKPRANSGLQVGLKILHRAMERAVRDKKVLPPDSTCRGVFRGVDCNRHL